MQSLHTGCVALRCRAVPHRTALHATAFGVKELKVCNVSLFYSMQRV